ncbi:MULTISPECIES: hypothetical protein [Roseomonadaceae]|uniref:Chromosome partitioning protein ParB n=1 Tax=Falsiroseomonas oleicola TaxID=2801474 RepID=A0ABS6H2U8_9PROT|nr:hypothetical protein [Roseomonas oleicola]MBU8542172.1 hypothetical protein [Roseomonas oleicola]
MTVIASHADGDDRRASASGGTIAKEPLQVRIPTAVKRRFKAHAAMRGLEPSQLFIEIWEHYEATFKADPTQTET